MMMRNKKLFFLVIMGVILITPFYSYALFTYENFDCSIGRPPVGYTCDDSRITFPSDGYPNYGYKLALQFTAPETAFLCSSYIAIENNFEAGNIKTYLYFDGTEPENGVLIASATRDTADFPTGYTGEPQYTEMPFETCALVSRGFSYYYVIETNTIETSGWSFFPIVSTSTSIIPYGYLEEWAVIEFEWQKIGGEIPGTGEFSTQFHALILMKQDETELDLSYYPEYATSTWDFIEQDFGLLGNALNDVLKFLFVPKQNVFDNFLGIFDLIKEKPPIGYFVLVTNSLTGLSTSTPVFSVEGMASVSSIFDPLKTGLSMILWFMFTFWIFRRIANLEL